MSYSDPKAPTIVNKPSELLGIFASCFSQQDVSKQVIFLQVIYWKYPKNNLTWAYHYDVVRYGSTQSEITLQIPHYLAEGLKDGSLVIVSGMLGCMQNDGRIQIQLLVSRIEALQDQAIDEDEIKRMEIHLVKASKGIRNVDSILEQLTNFTKNQEEAAKKHNEQVQAAQKQNKELQEKLTLIQKANTEQQQKQNKNQTELKKQLNCNRRPQMNERRNSMLVSRRCSRLTENCRNHSPL